MQNLLKYWQCLLLIYPLLLGCPGKKNDPEPEKQPTAQEVMADWSKEVSFTKITVSPGTWSYKDIVFNNGNAALLDNDNRIFFSYDNGVTWTERVKISGNTLQSIALKPDGEKLFIGGISLGPYTYGAKFWVYNTPKNGAASLDYNGEAILSQINDPINHDFQRTKWNGDGSVYASFGRSNKMDGFFGNITPDGRKIFVRRTPSFSRIDDREPGRQPSHCAGFYIKNNSETTILCVSEYSPTGSMNFLSPYQSETKGSGNSWLPLANYWKADFVYHIGQDLTGKHAVYVSQANRLFYDGKHLVNYKNLQGDLQCASIDNNGYLWVGTSNGLYKAAKKMPDLPKTVFDK